MKKIIFSVLMTISGGLLASHMQTIRSLKQPSQPKSVQGYPGSETLGEDISNRQQTKKEKQRTKMLAKIIRYGIFSTAAITAMVLWIKSRKK